MIAWLQDLRYSLRALAKRRLYTAMTIVVFALAIGANSTVFSIYDGLFLRPLPYPDDARLVMVHSAYPKMGLENGGSSIPNFLDWRTAPSLESLAMIAPESRTLDGEGRPEQLSLGRASASLFAVLGIAPTLGRGFTESEATPGNDRVVVLSHRLWTTHFGAQRDAVGRDVRLDGETFHVVGVMPKGFNFFEQPIDAWLPFAYTPEEAAESQRGQDAGITVGRLRPGATLARLNSELAELARRSVQSEASAAFAEATGFTARAESFRESRVGDLEQMLLILQGIVVVVLLIACANVANLQLARTLERRRELSVRTALGADRRRLARLVFLESLSLAVAGALAGLAIAHGGLALVRALGLDRSTEGFEFALDPKVLGFTAGIAVLAASFSALLPLLESTREDVARVINSASRLGGGPGARRFRGGLVVVQLAAGVALLAGAGLLTTSFYRIEQRGPGFDADGVFSAAVALPENRYSSPEARARFYERALAELGALPGVTRAGLTSSLPFSGHNDGANVAIEGYTPPAGAAPPVAQLRSVSAAYFASLGIPVVEGRGFNADESERVAVIDEVMAHKYWPNGGALGQRVRQGADPPDRWYTVVGVVPFVRHLSLTDDWDAPTVYWYYKQRAPAVAVFTLRTSLDPELLAAPARAVLAGIDPELALYDVVPMDVRIARSLGPQRTPMVLTLVFAAIALTLAIVGIYGVLTSSVTQSVGEIGVRVALGAGVADVVRMVVAEGGRLIAIGVVLGGAAAVGLGRLLASQVQEVRPFEPGVLIAAIAVLTATAVFASWVPARRASRIDPMQALRKE